ncbi:MAG: hypothetical protein GVY16_11720 [Planctomycetes bacterium]|jgi:hypothetical protein|nr:hypothetical protein [Planctomycetota bacterium]
MSDRPACLALLAAALLAAGCAPANPVDPGAKADAVAPPDPAAGATTCHVEWPRWRNVTEDTQVGIMQDAKLLPIHHGQVRIEPRPFTIAVRMPVGKTLWLNAQTAPTFVNALRSGQRVYDLIPFAATGMAEYPRNERRTLAMASEAYHVWAYMDQENHRFDADSVHLDGQTVTARRTVEFYHDVDTDGPGDGKEKPIAGLAERDLFLVFFRTSGETPADTNRFGGGEEEIGRMCIELKFED